MILLMKFFLFSLHLQVCNYFWLKVYSIFNVLLYITSLLFNMQRISVFVERYFIYDLVCYCTLIWIHREVTMYKNWLLCPYLLTLLLCWWQRLLSNGKLSRRASGSSSGSPASGSSKRGSDKKKASTTMVFMSKRITFALSFYL